MRNTPLFITIVGSHMWEMQRPGSDMDRNIVFAVPAKVILGNWKYSKTIHPATYTMNSTVYEDVHIEIGHLVDQLIKGNVNAIWTLTSPKVEYRFKTVHRNLRELFVKHAAKNCYHSIRGMSLSQQKDAYKLEAEGAIQKKLATAKRTLMFGATFLKTGMLDYTPVQEVLRKESLEPYFHDLDVAYEESILPDKVDEEIFREWLYAVRSLIERVPD